jgi:glycosyltransferase involved in cell wall biosynthesis
VQIKCRLLYLVGQLGLGGLERQLFYLIRSMDRERYKPVVAVWGNSPDDRYVREIRALDVPVISLGDYRRPAKLRALRRLVSSLRPEVVHSYSFYTNIAAWCASLGTKTVVIGSVRNNFIFERRETGKLLGRMCGRWPAVQIFNSMAAKVNAKQYAAIFRPRRIYVVRNGVDLDRFSSQSHTPRQRYILAVGNLYPRKRWDRLIRAVAHLASSGSCPEVKLVGSGPLRGELEALARELRVDHLVRFLGAQEDIPALLADSAFLVHTAEDEGCPNVILEAMACGRAVLATDAGDAAHLIDSGKTGFIVGRDDENTLADCIAMLHEDSELCRRMGEAGRIKAKEAFGLDRLRLETFSVYKAEGWGDR